ncbi:MAG: protein kinase domain-containing protein [Isosphaeraceae bacterium]
MPRRDSALRELLFGILALQNGMISRDQLVAGFSVWTAGGGRAMAEILAEQRALAPEHRSLLEALVLAHLKLHEGNAEKSLAALEVKPSTLESLARIGGPVLENTLAHVGTGPDTTSACDDDDDRTGSFLSVGSSTSLGQRFRVLRPHARGGLGAVYVALDTELNREVALKQILDRFADDATSRERFVLEAEVTGGLEHPGIVPVYGLGAYADGRPFYAMRFIRGESLKEAIENFHGEPGRVSAGSDSHGELGRVSAGSRSPKTRGADATPLAFRKLLRRFLDVCNAIDYAHSRGILHRDIKPGNIIVGKHGETLVVDWGLAKATGKSEPGAAERTLLPRSGRSSETLPGSALGTPAYMSPEQARGDVEALGPRSDVYSLGGTLYCLLTGKPPFQGEDAGAVLRAVQQGEFPRPAQLDATIDPAVEAVCLKAMARQPEDRYATPRQLADDLDRWMADEPVTAWREPWTRTSLRWVTRHRTGVTAAGAALLVALAGLVAVAAVQAQANDHLHSVNLDLSVASARVRQANGELSAAKEDVEARLNLAMAAIKMYHTGVSEDLLLQQSQFRTLRGKLLGGARDFYRKLEGLLAGRTDPPAQAALGRAYQELGTLTDSISSKDQALVVFEQALAVRRALAARPGAGRAEQADLAQSLWSLGILHDETGRPAIALGSLEEARGLLEGLVSEDPANLDYQADLASCLNSIGIVQATNGQPAGALPVYTRALEMRRSLVRVDSASTRYRRDLARSYLQLGWFYSRSAKFARSLGAYESARDILRALANDNPTTAHFQRDLEQTYFYIGLVQSQSGHLAQALEADEQALAIIRRMLTTHGAVARFQNDLVKTQAQIGSLLARTGRAAAARVAHAEALETALALARSSPGVTDYQIEAAAAHEALGDDWLRDGRSAEALAAFERSRAIVEPIANENPRETRAHSELARMLVRIGELHVIGGRGTAAAACFQRANSVAGALAAEEPDVTDFQNALAASFKGLGLLAASAGRLDEARASLERARSIYSTLALAESMPDQFYALAAVESLLAGVAAAPGSGLPEAAARGHENAAFDALKRAVAAGYHDIGNARSDKDLDALRSRPEFPLLMMDLAMPAEAFAHQVE